MDENRVEGTVRNVGGKVQEGFGRVAGDARARGEGLANQAAGKAQDFYGQAADTARETASHWMVGCGTRSKLSLTRLLCLRSASDGFWAGCIGLCDKEWPAP